MSVEYTREVIGDGIALTVLKDKKFKTNMVTVKLLAELDEKTAASYALIAPVLVSCNEKYPTRTEFTVRQGELYDASISSSVRKYADMYILSFNASCIKDAYALDGEKLTEEVVGALLDCLFHPVIENGGFASKEFELCKKDLLDSIDSLINDKGAYCVHKAFDKVFEGEAYSVYTTGTREAVEALGPVSLYKDFQKLLRTAQIEIMVGGGGDGELDPVVEMLKKAFTSVERDRPVQLKLVSYSPLKAECAYVSESMDVNQCKMLIAYKSSYENSMAARVMSAMFGGTAFSKLFLNIREKMSLCYYCNSRIVDGKGTLIVESGVDKKNISLAQEGINDQLKDMASGNFTDEEMANTKLMMIGNMRSGYDSLPEVISWYFLMMLRGKIYTEQEYIDEINSVTREQITQCAASYALDTVYVLESEEV